MIFVIISIVNVVVIIIIIIIIIVVIVIFTIIIVRSILQMTFFNYGKAAELTLIVGRMLLTTVSYMSNNNVVDNNRFMDVGICTYERHIAFSNTALR